MSAIFGIFYPDGRPVARVELNAMSERLAHRGTDEVGSWNDGFVGLGHRMRRTTPESQGEHLPKSYLKGRFFLTADARIDNRDELIDQLGIATLAARETVTDADIIAASYEKWGERCIEKFLGDFVFMIWDSVEQKLFCGRDSMGVKHFYYYYAPNRMFALASEIKALFAIEGVPRELDEKHIGDILILNYYEKENTPFKKIKRLPANHAMTVDRGGLRIWQYWTPKPSAVNGRQSDRDYEEEFKDVFTRSVNCRMRSSYRVGSMLSGGLDSSSISCVASKYLTERAERPLDTFSAVFPSIAKVDPRIDERKFIDSVLAHTECSPTFIEADSFSPLQDMQKMQWHADHPIGVPNVFMDWALFKSAKARNVRTLLSGFDGDSTVSYGYDALPELIRQGHWIRMITDSLLLMRNMPHGRHTAKRLLWKDGFKPAIPEFALQARRVLAGRPKRLPPRRQMPSAIKFGYRYVDPDFAGRIDLENRYFEQTESNFPDGVDHSTEWWNGLCSGLFSFALETFEKTAAAFEVEPRFPFFDRRVIEFCLALPARQRLLGGWTRSILRRAMKGVLPEDVRWRTDKANIGLSFKLNMLKYSRREIESVIYDRASNLERFLDTKKLIGAYQRYESDPLKFNGEPMLIMSAVQLSNWLRNTFSGANAHGYRTSIGFY